ncbi:MAG TPA: hypothetical protein VG500_16735 [Gemmatimonadales bacterium]|nr:hypothetical protein [Gemmatimonadales bacterium]
MGTPARWTALGLCLVAAAVACSHSEPFSNPQGTDQPFDPSPPVRLTFNQSYDGEPAWLADGSGILYSSQQLEREDADVCLAELPPTGGSRRRLVCDIPGDRSSTDASRSAAAALDGTLALVSAGNGNLGGTSPVFTGIALTSLLDARDPQLVRGFPFTPAGGTPHDYAGYLRWVSPEVLVYVGQLFKVQRACPEPGCPLDTLIVGTDVTLLDLAGPSPAGTAVPGTALATGVAPVLDGTAILYTLADDTRIYRRVLSGGEVSVVHDFGAAGIARDLHAAGGRVAAVVGGRVAFSIHPLQGPVQWDSGGVLHVVELGGDDLVLDTPGRLYRRPALSPDGTSLVAEGYPLIITGPPAARDTTVAKSGDLYLFGAQ